jgi:hypothetical protein
MSRHMIPLTSLSAERKAAPDCLLSGALEVLVSVQQIRVVEQSDGNWSRHITNSRLPGLTPLAYGLNESFHSLQSTDANSPSKFLVVDTAGMLRGLGIRVHEWWPVIVRARWRRRICGKHDGIAPRDLALLVVGLPHYLKRSVIWVGWDAVSCISAVLLATTKCELLNCSALGDGIHGLAVSVESRMQKPRGPGNGTVSGGCRI